MVYVLFVSALPDLMPNPTYGSAVVPVNPTLGGEASLILATYIAMFYGNHLCVTVNPYRFIQGTFVVGLKRTLK